MLKVQSGKMLERIEVSFQQLAASQSYHHKKTGFRLTQNNCPESPFVLLWDLEKRKANKFQQQEEEQL
jgi:hypothetical protein